jgi:hypothetical protein
MYLYDHICIYYLDVYYLVFVDLLFTIWLVKLFL